MFRRVSLSLLLPLVAAAATAGDPESKFRPAAAHGVAGEYIVVLHEGTEVDAGARRAMRRMAAVAAEARRHGGSVERVWRRALPGFLARMSSAQAARLAEDPRVRFVEQNAVSTVQANVGLCNDRQLFAGSDSFPASPQPINCPNPPGDCVDNWGLRRIAGNGPGGSFSFVTGPHQVRIYTLDVGMAGNHVQFEASDGSSRFRAGTNVLVDRLDPLRDDPSDSCTHPQYNSHGTHVAGIAAGKTYGVAKNALLYPVRVTECGNNLATADLLDGIDWILGQHPSGAPGVVNLSANGAVMKSSQALAWASTRLVQAGISFVQSAGNREEPAANVTLSGETSPGGRTFPPEIIVVGGIDQNNERWERDAADPLCSGSVNDCGSNFGSAIDLWAPAAFIVSASNVPDPGDGPGAPDPGDPEPGSLKPYGVCQLSGTSMAAPHVTGVAALLLSRFPSASPSAVEEALVENSIQGQLSDLMAGSPNRLVTNQFPASGPPVAGDDRFYTHSGTPIRVFHSQLLRGDFDWDGGTLVIHSIGAPDVGFIETAGGSFVWQHPDPQFVGVATIPYTVRDASGLTDQALIRIVVEGFPAPPVARNDCFELDANGEKNFGPSLQPVLANDSDPNGDLVRVEISRNPDHGELGFFGFSSDYVYKAGPSFPGRDSFDYVVDDAMAQTDEATVYLRSGANSCVFAAPDQLTTPAGTSLTFLASDLLANDHPRAIFLFAEQPLLGTLAIDGIGPTDILYRYVPSGCVGSCTDQFDYWVEDEEDGVQVRGTVTVLVQGQAQAPVANPDLFTTPVNTRLRFYGSTLTANDTPGAVFIRAENAQLGTLELAGIGPEDIVYDYVPPAGFIGTDTFEYLISADGNEPYVRGTATVEVEDAAPVPAFAASCSGLFCSFDASTSDDDVGIAAYAWSFGDGGSGSGMTAGHTYSRGSYSVGLTVTDTRGQTGSISQVVVADALPVPSFTVNCTGRTCTFDASAASDDGGIVAYTWAFGDGAAGSGVTVTHTYATSGSKTATLTVRDTVGQTASTSRTFTIDLSPTACFTVSCSGLTCSFNAACSSDDLGISAYAWNFGDGATGSGVTASRTYATSGPRTVTLTVTDTGGKTNSTTRTANPDQLPLAAFTWSCTQRTCSFNATGSTDNQPLAAYAWTFGDGSTGSGATPTRTYAAGGSYSVKLTVTDSIGQQDDETKTIAVNRPPVAVPDSGSTFRDTPVDLNVLANDSDADGNPLTVTAWTQGAHGAVTKNPNGTLRYTPHAGYTGGDSFGYTVSDGKGDTANASVSMTVTAPNNPPDARDDGWRTYQNGPTNIPYSHLLANDYDPNGDTLAVTGISTAGLTGTLDCSSGTYCRYTPPSWFVGATSFTYSAADGKGGTDPATVRVKVGIANNIPVPQDDILETTRNTALTVTRATLLANDTDPDGDVLSIMSFTRLPLVGFGTLSCSAAYYTCTYTPPTGFTGVDVLTYRSTDGIDFNDARVRILVRPATTSALDAREDQIFSTTNVTYISYTRLLSNDYAPAGGLTVVGIDTTGLVGTLDCTTYTTGCDYYRGTSDPTRFRYTVRDAQGNLDTTTVTIKAGNWSWNKLPVLADDTMTAVRNTPKAFTVFDLFRNDYDPDNDQLNIPGLWYTPNGRITCSMPTYACTYTPNANFAGVDTFTYYADDGTNSASATVTINVSP